MLKIEIFLKYSRILVPGTTGKEIITIGKIIFDPGIKIENIHNVGYRLLIITNNS